MISKNKKLRILIAEPEGYSPRAISTLKKLGKVYKKGIFKPGFKKNLSTAGVLVIKLGVKVDKKLLDAAKNLKAVATNTTGLNHIDLKETQKRGVAVISLRGQTDFLKNVRSTPELTFALILSLFRKIPWVFDSVKKGEWNRTRYCGNEIFGKTLGLLGFGRVGKMIAHYARAFGMKIIAVDPGVSAREMKKARVRKVNMDKLFRNSDVLSVHASYSPGTDKMVKEKHLRLMKASAVFINTARGELVDEVALLRALKNKWIAGAGLDVMRNEDARGGHLRGHSLLDYARSNQNLIIVPHIGGATFEAWQATEDFLADLVVKHFKK